MEARVNYLKITKENDDTLCDIVEQARTLNPLDNALEYACLINQNEAIHLLLTGIGDEIYSTVDACKTAHEMWIAIERLQQDSNESKIYKPTNNNLRTSSNSRKKNVDTSPRYKNDNPTGQFGNQNKMTVARAKETVGSQVVQQTGIQCFNCKEFGHFAKECKKPKRVKDYTYHKEKMLMCKQAEKGVPLQAKQADWLADTDEEINEQELEAHYSVMAKIQEVPTADSGTDTEPLEKENHEELELAMKFLGQDISGMNLIKRIRCDFAMVDNGIPSKEILKRDIVKQCDTAEGRRITFPCCIKNTTQTFLFAFTVYLNKTPELMEESISEKTPSPFQFFKTLLQAHPVHHKILTLLASAG
ncbi:retrovirus-related pol polyprotein from transposon TNT 1-94 [Tanacetum coccineum]|uniref:Retrovirus-related pol polyprotein from transposon TNT 1-94 n=1 Tax=Tanacetum coccineum TaxID=301880 RepID=A0ABQ5A4N7_9ASTR